ncbi:MAG: phosphoethanolamine--lipid A transferase, partial [Burkholderiales bacterium]
RAVHTALPDSHARWQVIATLAGIVVCTLFALFSLIGWTKVFRPLASALVVTAALSSHFITSYGTVIDTSMMANVLNTDTREVRDLMSWRLVWHVLLVAGPALVWLWRTPLRIGRPGSQWLRNGGGIAVGLLLSVVIALTGYQGLASLMRNQKTVRYLITPLNTLYATGHLAVRQLPALSRPMEPIGLDARLGASYQAQARPPLLVLVIGETLRAENFGLDGYARPTTPVLADWQRQRGLVNFPDVTACGTNTEVSLPCIFSPLTRAQGGNRKPRHENLLDVLQRAGLAVLWLDNQSGCKGVCDRVPNDSLRASAESLGCTGGECHDEVLLESLDQRMAALEPERFARGAVLVLHQMGSHGPAYHKRTPANFKPFSPECQSQSLSDCGPEELRNAYDNTVAYTDRFLGRALQWLDARSDRFDTGMVYVSDHGESLGEAGLYLHGLPYALAPSQQTRVPMVAWISPGLQARAGLDTACLAQRAKRPVSHDHLFHSVLGLMDVVTTIRDEGLNLFGPCDLHNAAFSVGHRPETGS